MISVSRLLCLIGRHRRSRGHARRGADGYRSKCRRCGVPMRKSDKGGWKVDEVAPDAAPMTDVPAPAPAASATAGRGWHHRLWPFGKKAETPAA